MSYNYPTGDNPYNPSPSLPTPQAGPYPSQPMTPMPMQPGYPGGYTITSASAPQKNMMVFVGSILMLVGAGIYTILGIDLLALVVEYGRYADGFDYFAAIFAFIAAAVLVVVGIMGIKNAADIHKGDFLFPLGIAVCIIPVISLAIAFVQGTSTVSAIGGFLLPWPFIFGANTMKQQAQAIGGPSYPGSAQQYPGAQQYPAVSPQYPASPQQYPAAPQQYPGTPGQYPGTTQPYPGTPGQ